jgi:hypothetical protein
MGDNEKVTVKASPRGTHEVPLGEACSHMGSRPKSRSALSVSDWVWLNENDRVKVQREYEPVTAGVIDVVAHDASIFWVWLDGGRGRVALHMDDNVSVWFEEEQD